MNYDLVENTDMSNRFTERADSFCGSRLLRLKDFMVYLYSLLARMFQKPIHEKITKEIIAVKDLYM